MDHRARRSTQGESGRTYHRGTRGQADDASTAHQRASTSPVLTVRPRVRYQGLAQVVPSRRPAGDDGTPCTVPWSEHLLDRPTMRPFRPLSGLSSGPDSSNCSSAASLQSVALSDGALGDEAIMALAEDGWDNVGPAYQDLSVYPADRSPDNSLTVPPPVAPSGQRRRQQQQQQQRDQAGGDGLGFDDGLVFDDGNVVYLDSDSEPEPALGDFQVPFGPRVQETYPFEAGAPLTVNERLAGAYRGARRGVRSGVRAGRVLAAHAAAAGAVASEMAAQAGQTLNAMYESEYPVLVRHLQGDWVERLATLTLAPGPGGRVALADEEGAAPGRNRR